MLRPISNASHLSLQPSLWWHSVLVLIIDDIFFKYPQYSDPIISILLTLSRPFLFAFPMPLRTAQMCHWYWIDYHWLSTMRISSDASRTRSSAALQKSRPSESWMWICTKDVALKICSSYSELKELTQKCIFSLKRQFMVSHKLIQCSKSNI